MCKNTDQALCSVFGSIRAEKERQKAFHTPQVCKTQLEVQGIQVANFREAQQSQSILSTNFGLKSNFATCFKVRYKGASSLCSYKKNRTYICNKCLISFKQNLIYKSFSVNFLSIRFLLSFDSANKLAITSRY